MKLINFFKLLFFNSKLPFLNIGDIIWAKRYDTEEEMQKIEAGHRESPFIVIHKSINKIYALQCGSNLSSYNIPFLKYNLNRKKYNMKKNGYVFVGRLVLLNKDRYINTIGALDKYDLNKIYKSIYLINSRYKHLKIRHFPKRKLKFYFETGDIVLYNNQTFYIIEVDENYYYAHQCFESNKGKITIKINNIPYSINFIGRTKIAKSAKLKLLNMADTEKQKLILNTSIEKNKVNTHDQTLSRGKLISLNEKFYYIYGLIEGKLQVFQVYDDINVKPNTNIILIKNKKYYTAFEESLLEKNDEIIVLRKALDSEVDKIKLQKKNFKLKEKCETLPIVGKVYKPGFIIIENKTLNQYVIIKRNRNIIAYVPLNNPSKYEIFNLDSNEPFDFQIYEKLDKYKFKKILELYDYVSNNNTDLLLDETIDLNLNDSTATDIVE